jgi:rhamnogalacturonan endolyase
MIHGTHYQASSSDTFAANKTWGPWLWYLNNGSKDDAARRLQQEMQAWPYTWFKDAAYQSRGSIQGRLVLSDGRPASGAAVFLGDNYPNTTALDQGRNYYYTTYADENGAFSIDKVRTGSYGLQAWSNGGPIADVSSSLLQNDILVRKSSTTDLQTIPWAVTNKSNIIFRVGSFDRKTDGFALSGPTPFEHGRIAKCPANLTYTVGSSETKTEDWCFGQSALGTHSIIFPISNSTSNTDTNTTRPAKLLVSLAGFSSGSSADILLNSRKIGNITSGSALLPSSQDTYRGATRAGEWHLLEFGVERGLLTGDKKNRLHFKVTKSTLWRGWLWDAVILEWV